MAYTFNNFKNISGANMITGYPFTMSCWVKTNGTASNIFVLHGTGSSISDSIIIYADTVVQGYVFSGGTPRFAQATAGLTSNVWQHLCFVCSSATSQTIYLNGGNSATQTVSFTPNFTNIVTVRMGWLGSANSIQGDACEFAIWNAALNASEVVSLSKSFASHLISPDNLVFYAPLIREIQDISGGITLTNNNSATVANHPRIYGI